MDVGNEDRCWTCKHSDFETVMGLLHCYQDNKARAVIGSCPYSKQNEDKSSKENAQNNKRLSQWRSKLGRLMKSSSPKQKHLA